MNPDELNTFAIALQRQIYQLVKSYELCDKVCLSQYGVSSSQGYAMLSLPQEGSLTMNELSERMELSCSTMTRIVDPLVNKMFVQRKSDYEDRRIVRISLTEQGQKLRLSMEKELQDFFKHVLGEVQDDELQIIVRSIEKISLAFSKACKDSCTT